MGFNILEYKISGYRLNITNNLFKKKKKTATHCSFNEEYAQLSEKTTENIISQMFIHMFIKPDMHNL